MSAKRQATSDLNHDNWDRVEEPEERGTYRTASEDELRSRVIKKARRTKTTTTTTTTEADDADANSATKNIFSGFGGFKNTTTTEANTSSASPFSFLTKIPTVAAAAVAAPSSPQVTTPFSFGSSTATTGFGSSKSIFGSSIVSSSSGGISAKNSGKSTSYYSKLKAVNLSVAEWIKTHVDKNPICILTPIFKDYEKHINDIEKEENSSNTHNITTTKINTPIPISTVTSKIATSEALKSFRFSPPPSTSLAPSNTTAPASTATFSFLSTTPTAGSQSAASTSPSGSIFSGFSKPATTESGKSNGFVNFKAGDTNPTTTTTSIFGFGKPSTLAESGDKPTGFTFTSSTTPFTFGNLKPPAPADTAAETTEKAQEEDEDEPPKVEFKQVVEEDAVYSKKCKVYIKKDKQFVDCGVGTLYLKPVNDGDKTQLLVRADTNLGNVLVNLILSPALPVKRMGKNDVMMICLPTPDYKKPTTMLMRVKTGDEADELLSNITKYTK